MKRIAMAWKYAMIYVVAFALVCCTKAENPEPDPVPEPEPEITEEQRLLLKANKFVYNITTEAYLWSKSIPSNITYTSADNPKDLFELMRNKDLDRWSNITDNAEETLESFQGVSTTYGYSLALAGISNLKDTYIAFVQFVYPNSPAQKAGLKRGDIIIALDGNLITSSNVKQLYYSSTISLMMGKINSDGGVEPLESTVNLSAVKMYEDPVVEYNVIEARGKKIGYLCYTNFFEDSKGKLVEVFNNFKLEGVSDLILDLRYNQGGDASIPPYLASMIAPASVVKQSPVFLTQTWNDFYMSYFKLINEDMNEYFYADIPVNLNLDRVYILTSVYTASASEATISGLMPYMDVVTVGERTYGKYCGAALIPPMDENGEEDKELSNWLLTLVVYKFVNTQGFTEFKDGIAPDYEVADTGLVYGIQLGDPNDPMIAKALEVITGNVTKAPSLVAPQGVKIIPNLLERPLRGGMNYLWERVK